MAAARAPNLVALSRAEFFVVKRLAEYALRLDVLAALFALLAGILAAKLAVVLLASGSIVAAVLARVFQYLGRIRHRVAERARRALILSEGTGAEMPSAERAHLEAAFSDAARRNAARYTDDQYYRVSGPPGPDRLRRLIQESAFWTARLCRPSALRLLPQLIGYPVVVTVLLVMAAVASSGVLVLAGRVVAAAVILWAGDDYLGAFLAFRHGAVEAERIDRSLDDVRAYGNVEPLLPALRDYDVLVAELPPIPEAVYQREHDRLHQIWERRIAGRSEEGTVA